MRRLSLALWFGVGSIFSFSVFSVLNSRLSIINSDVLGASDTSLEFILNSQILNGSWLLNPVKYAIHGAVEAGVSANTIVLLLLLPLVAAFIAGARHIVGIRGFGIFLPAALAVVFVAMGPVLGIGLFLLVISISTLIRLFLRKFKIRLQYLPRMAFLLWMVIVGVLIVLFLAPFIPNFSIVNISIFPVLISVLLSDDFTRVQIGKSVKTAISLTFETLILALVSFLIFTFRPLQEFAILNPEILLLAILVFDLFLGSYIGLRVREVWRFRKLINS